MGNVQVTTARATEATLRQMSDRVAALTSVLSAPTTTPVRTLYDYGGNNDDRPDYKGTNQNAVSEFDANWVIHRYFYDSRRRVADEQVLVGAWVDRATLNWNT